MSKLSENKTWTSWNIYIYIHTTGGGHISKEERTSKTAKWKIWNQMTSHETPNCTNLKSTGFEAATGYILLPVQTFIFFLPWVNHPWANKLRRRLPTSQLSVRMLRWKLSNETSSVGAATKELFGHTHGQPVNKMEWVHHRRDTCEMKSYRIWKNCA